MKWKTNRDTFLILENIMLIPFIYGGVGLEGGERFDESAEYIETDMSGRFIKRYERPNPFAIDSEMTVSNIHLVIGDCLYKFYYSQVFGYKPVIQSDVVLSELEMFQGELPFGEVNFD